MVKEACVETLEEALSAQKKGASQIELCADLANEGLTPETDLIKRVKSELHIPIKVMIRPRAGNFVYSIREIEEMYKSIILCKEINVAGVVFGILDEHYELDMAGIAELSKIASPLQVTIHKAIDLTPDPVESIKQLLTIPGIHTVLTSGGASTAMEGAEILKKMIHEAGNHIQIMAAGRITQENLEEVHATIGGKAYHGRKILGNLDF